MLVAGGYNGSHPTSAELYDPAAGTWSTTGSLANGGENRSATLLPNGNVLIAGGYNRSIYLTSAEIYDPAAGTWSATGSLATARYAHSATLLPSGMVLVAGGYGSSFLASAEIYDPAAGTWSATGSLASARYSHSTLLLPTGKLLVAGGYNGNAVATAELYDVGLGFSGASQPVIGSASFNASGGLVLTGTGFLGISSASGGNGSQNSPTNYPVVQIRRMNNEQCTFLMSDASTNTTATSFVSAPIAPVSGYAMVTVFTNGIPSAAVLVNPTLVTITGISLASGGVTGGTSVTITGTGFTGATAVNFGGIPASSFTVNSSTSITAITPAHAVGNVDVAVTTSTGGAMGTNLYTYTTIPPFELIQGWVVPALPFGGLIQGNDGDFYGTTYDGGSGHYGTVFKMTAAGTLTNLVNFTSTNGSRPFGGLIQGGDGDFYGTTSNGGSGGYGTVFKVTAAGTFTTLVNFTSSNGSNPEATLIQGSDGNFYGTTANGGSDNNGTAFKMTAGGALTTLVNFNSTNGNQPNTGLIQGSDGNFYGTTTSGGSINHGTAFKMTADGVLTTLVNFNSSSHPYAGLIQGSDGDFYGTTSDGGSGLYGTVFKVTAAGTFTTLVNFNSTNGGDPRAALIQASDGNFYGTTEQGGSNGKGTVFKMTPSGTLITLVNFTNTNGSNPYAALVQGSDGNLYGITTLGGTTADGQSGGHIFRLRMGPSVTSQPQTNVSGNSATLNAIVNPNGYATPVSFQYGTDPTLATFSSVNAGTLAAGGADVAVYATISGLQPGTTYYYRVLASNLENTVPQSSSILSFATLTAAESWRKTFFNDTANTGDAADSADPDHDGVVNLLERAFNLNPTQPGRPILTAGTGTSGLPLIRRTGQPPVFSIQYIRLKASTNSGLTYTPQFSSSLDGGAWTAATGTETVESIDSEWERVTITDTASSQTKRFGRVMVTASP